MSTESSTLESISKYAVSTMADKDAFAELRSVAEQVRKDYPGIMEQYDVFMGKCRDGEDEFMQINYGNDPDAKHTSGKRNGQWKYRTYLPKGYNTAKLELGKALEAGTAVTGLGKTAINKARTETTKRERTVEECIADYTGKLKRAIASIDDPDERQRQRENAMREIATL